MSSAWGVFVRAFSSKIYVENMLHLGVLCLCFALNAIFIAPFMTNVERQGVRNPILVPHVHKIDFITPLSLLFLFFFIPNIFCVLFFLYIVCQMCIPHFRVLL